MPRRSDIEITCRSSIAHENSGRRIVKTYDFVQELLKVNWCLSMEEANQWIARYTACFKDITPNHGENKTWFMYTLTEVFDMGFPSPAKDYIERTLTIETICGVTANSLVIETSHGLAVIEKGMKPSPGSTCLISYSGGCHFAKRRGDALITIDGEVLDDSVWYCHAARSSS